MIARMTSAVCRLVCFAIVLRTVTCAMAGEPNPTTPARPPRLGVALYLADPELVLGRGTDVIVKLANDGEATSRYFTYVGVRVFHTQPDGSRVPLQRREREVPPATIPPAVPAAPDPWSHVLSVCLEIDCPYDARHLEPFSVDLSANGKMTPAALPPHQAQLIERHLPDWVFVSGDCRVRAVLYEGQKEIGSSGSRTILVKQAVR